MSAAASLNRLVQCLTLLAIEEYESLVLVCFCFTGKNIAIHGSNIAAQLC
jgi:hypothetical protein